MQHGFWKSRKLWGFILALGCVANITISACLAASSDYGVYSLDGITLLNTRPFIVPKEHYLFLLSTMQIVSCPRFDYLKLSPFDEIELTAKDIMILTHHTGTTPSPELEDIRTWDPVTVYYRWPTMSIGVYSGYVSDAEILEMEQLAQLPSIISGNP